LEELSRPLRAGARITLEASVLDGNGGGIAGTRVFWSASNGSVSSGSSVSDGFGLVRTTFTAGRSAGPARATVTIPGLDSAAQAFDLHPEPPNEVPRELYLPTLVPTYEGSGETVHPDVALAPFRLPEHLAITPYPGGRSDREQPSLFASYRGLDWLLPTGGPNPVIPQPPDGYLSDPDLVYQPDSHELWLYYRHAVAGRNLIYRVRSSDGIRWSRAEAVLDVAGHQAVSPTEVRRGADDWLMWVVNAGREGCIGRATRIDLRASRDGVHWTYLSPVELKAGPLFPWHLEVQWIPTRHEFWALFNAKPSGHCSTPALFLATSPDGIRWTTVDYPVARKGIVPEFEDIVYRSTFHYDPVTDDVWLWISGARFRRRGWVWSTMEVRRERRALMEPIAGGAELLIANIGASTHRLTDWPD
jgi:hypothetical protein